MLHPDNCFALWNTPGTNSTLQVKGSEVSAKCTVIISLILTNMLKTNAQKTSLIWQILPRH